jgi:hypothetical protein
MRSIIIGDKKHLLTLVERIQKDHNTYFKCLCDCGAEKIIHCGNWGRQKSCGDWTKHFSGPNAKRYGGYQELSGKYWYSIKQGAIKRKIDFDLLIEDAFNLFENQNRKCALSGIDITLLSTNQIKQTASLDRIQSGKGYVLSNIQWVHKDINNLKMEFSTHDFLQWCHRVVQYTEAKNDNNS